MPAETALALVVRTTDWSETSRIATMFTREFGKVRVLAKGGRRLKSNFEVALDLLTVCRIVLLRKSPGSLDILTEAQVAERFPDLRTNLPALYAAYYVAELLAEGTEEYDPHPTLFDAALVALRDFGTAGPRQGPRLVAFELTWLHELGYSPALDVCAACGCEVGDRVAFSAAAGGVICPTCRPAERERRSVTPGTLAALRAMSADPDAWRQDWRPAVRSELRSILGQYVTYRLGRRLRTLPYVVG
ncbi:MAG TPA: DNA repair protein RecO [Gemmataceae bacterium]|jgi:DNA repair protein RecO (recombination protein O)|nr:DNA repair protein RecO [Gemmataceae bacterium]